MAIKLGFYLTGLVFLEKEENASGKCGPRKKWVLRDPSNKATIYLQVKIRGLRRNQTGQHLALGLQLPEL